MVYAKGHVPFLVTPVAVVVLGVSGEWYRCDGARCVKPKNILDSIKHRERDRIKKGMGKMQETYGSFTPLLAKYALQFSLACFFIGGLRRWGINEDDDGHNSGQIITYRPLHSSTGLLSSMFKMSRSGSSSAATFVCMGQLSEVSTLGWGFPAAASCNASTVA